jgi:hypothetical protein
MRMPAWQLSRTIWPVSEASVALLNILPLGSIVGEENDYKPAQEPFGILATKL